MAATPEPIQGRALTPEAKRVIMERILVAWEQRPEFRLGQLIVNAIDRNPAHPLSLFFLEDEELAELLEDPRRFFGTDT